MKKFLVSCFLVASMFTGLYANPVEDAQFKDYVKKLMDEKKKEGSDNFVLLADPTHRIIFTVMPIAAQKAKLTPEVIQAIRKNVLSSMTNCKTEEDRKNLKLFKVLKIRMVFSLITTDKDIVTFSLSYLDLNPSQP